MDPTPGANEQGGASPGIPIDERALATARRAVEDALIEWRELRLSDLTAGNGFVVREADGTESSAIRLSTRDGLRIGIRAYLAAMQAIEDGTWRPTPPATGTPTPRAAGHRLVPPPKDASSPGRAED